MLLKNFSTDRKTLGMYSFTAEKLVEKAGFKEQCYENYLYGKDGTIENLLAEIEGETAPVFEKLISGKGSRLSIQEKYLIYRFITFQENRTMRAINDFNSMADNFAKSILKEDAKLNGINLDKVTIKPTEPTAFLLKRAAEEIKVLTDLDIKLLENDTDVDFIISDHPILMYNYWAERHPKFSEYPFSATGVALKGLIIFLPVSPRHLVILYDSVTYKCISQGGFSHKLKNSKDILWINRLQAVKAETCLYFKDAKKLGCSFYEYTETRLKGINVSRPTVNESSVRQRPDGKMSKFVITNRGDLKIKAQFSFLKVLDNDPYDGYKLAMLPLRDWAWLDRKEFSEP